MTALWTAERPFPSHVSRLRRSDTKVEVHSSGRDISVGRRRWRDQACSHRHLEADGRASLDGHCFKTAARTWMAVAFGSLEAPTHRGPGPSAPRRTQAAPILLPFAPRGPRGRAAHGSPARYDSCALRLPRRRCEAAAAPAHLVADRRANERGELERQALVGAKRAAERLRVVASVSVPHELVCVHAR